MEGAGASAAVVVIVMLVDGDVERPVGLIVGARPDLGDVDAVARGRSPPTTAVTVRAVTTMAAPRLVTALRKPLLVTGSLRPISAPATTTAIVTSNSKQI